MAQGSPSSSTLFFGATSAEDNMENSQPNHHLDDAMNQMNQSEVTYPDADYAIRVSPNTLLDANRHVCDVCDKGFPREQNLVLHQRTHNLPFALKKKTTKDPESRTVYLCPEPTCTRYNRSHALGDFGGLRKHYLRKHYTKKDYKCNNCCKAYSVETDLKAHLKTCGNRKYNCHCGACFSREYCNAQEKVGAAKHPQRLSIGDSSTNNNSHISSTISPQPMLGMGSNGFNCNENNYNLTSPHLSTLQDQSNYNLTPYQYHPSQFGMTNTSMNLNMSNNNSNFVSASTHPNQYEYQMQSDMDLYANLLMDNIPLESVTHQNVNMTGDGSFMYDQSSLNVAPAMHTNTQNGMPYPESGIRDVRSYGNGNYYDYDNGYGYGHGSGQFRYADGTGVQDNETSAATEGAVAAPPPHLNQDGFWY